MQKRSSPIEIAHGVRGGYDSQLTIAIILSAILVLGSLAWLSSGFLWFGPTQHQSSSNERNYPSFQMITGPGMIRGECMLGGCVENNQIPGNSAPPGNELPEGVQPTVEFGLRTGFDSAGFFYEGIGNEISDMRNPTLNVERGEVVARVIINGDGVTHNFVIAGLNVYSDPVRRGESASVKFIASELGEYTYYCNVPGHRESGMNGRLIIS